jgi:hypothetical protein
MPDALGNTALSPFILTEEAVTNIQRINRKKVLLKLLKDFASVVH